MRQPVAFHKYTDIQHYYRYAPALEPGTPVRITEKIHGTNSRVGLVNDNGLEYMVGTHHRRLKYGDADNFYAEEIECEEPSIYHRPLTDNMKRMLAALSLSGKNDVVVFGEIYGQRVQQMDYGMPPGNGYRVFDISVNSEYLNWADVKLLCETFGVETVPVLYEGPFEPELVDQFISGPTTLAEPGDIACKFKGREGIVITPLVEAYSSLMNKRLILKAVSSDYYEAMK
jgi:RNA ligase (TIGR02306 family)